MTDISDASRQLPDGQSGAPAPRHDAYRRPASTLLAHEWLAPHGGSENVFEQLALALPGARRHCLWNDAPRRFGPEVTETWLASTPLRRSKALALPFSSAAWHSVSLDDVDRVVVSSHAFGHHLASRAARAGIRSYAYVHTPARYLWSPDLDERGAGPAIGAAAGLLKRYDRSRTHAGVSYVANSRFVRDRIRAAWSQEAEVIYPPVPVERVQAHSDWADEVTGSEQEVLTSIPPTFVLGASRAVEYKRLDLAIRVGEVLDLPVVIAGDGPYRARLEAMAQESSVPVTFVGRVSDALLYSLYQRAALFAFMAVEDFGIMPVEAMSVGTPVLVNSAGGASESVGVTQGGASVSVDAVPEEVRERATEAMRCDPVAMRERCLYFSEDRFRQRIRDWVAPSAPSGRTAGPMDVAQDAHEDTCRVTVLLPVRNGGETVAEAVHSVVSDLGPSDELIVIDDGSTDGTCEAVARVSGPIRVVTNRGRGIVDALNTGLRLAEGTHIARCDADDTWLPGHLRHLRSALDRRPGSVAAFGAAALISSSGDSRGDSVPPSPADVRAALLRGNPFIHGTVLARADVVAAAGGYRDLPGAEDYDLWLRLSERGAIATTSESVYRYRLSEATAHRAKRRRQARSSLRILLGHAVRTGEISVRGILRNAASSLWAGPRFWYRP